MCERVDSRTVNRKVLEALIKCGACDCFGETRASLFAAIDRTLARAASITADRQRGQSSLFGMLEESPAPPAAGNGVGFARMAAARIAGRTKRNCWVSTSPAIR